MSQSIAAADSDAPLPVYAGARDFHWFLAGDVRLQSGEVLRDARLAYKTYGTLNAAADNCIVFPTYFTGTHVGNERLIGAGRALDPTRYFIVIPNLFGNGLSSSPSNATAGQRGAAFPHITIHDNVMCQQRLVMDHLGARCIRLALGWSMGALQVYQWAVSFPHAVERLLPMCGSARCWPLNYVFLEGVKAALLADPEYRGGEYHQPPERGLRAFGRAYAGWAYSAAFFRERLYEQLGITSLEGLLEYWERDNQEWDANDLLAMLWTWQHADPAHEHGGDLAQALGSIRARTVLMPCDTDQYFTLEENRIEAGYIPGAQLRPFVSPFGHCAPAPGRFAQETAFLERTLRELLES